MAARCVFAVVAGNRLVHQHLVFRLGVVQVVTVITIDAKPVHFAPSPNIVFANNGDVVFGLAGSHAGVAPKALAQINCHAPAVALIGVVGPKFVNSSSTRGDVKIFMMQVKRFGPVGVTVTVSVARMIVAVIVAVIVRVSVIVHRLHERNIVDNRQCPRQ